MRNMPCLLVILLVASANAGELRSDEKQALRLEDEWVRAMNVKDRKALDRILAPEFTFIEPDGTIKERAEYLADRTNEVVETESFDNADLKISLFGTTHSHPAWQPSPSGTMESVTTSVLVGRNCG